MLVKLSKRKAKLSYKIDMANPYYLDSVMYLKYPPRADSLIRFPQSSILPAAGRIALQRAFCA